MKSHMRQPTEGDSHPKQSNKPTGWRSHIDKSTSTKVPKQILVPGFHSSFPLSESRHQTLSLGQTTSVSLADLAIPCKCQATQQNQCWAPPQGHLASNELPFRDRSLFGPHILCPAIIKPFLDGNTSHKRCNSWSNNDGQAVHHNCIIPPCGLPNIREYTVGVRHGNGAK